MAWSVRLGFLGRAPFCFKDHVYEDWISLDFLGFSRPNRDLSISYTRFSAEKFFSSFCLTFEAPAGAPAVVVIRKAKIAHRVSLIWLLIFFKQLSSEPSSLGSSVQSQLALKREAQCERLRSSDRIGLSRTSARDDDDDFDQHPWRRHTGLAGGPARRVRRVHPRVPDRVHLVVIADISELDLDLEQLRLRAAGLG
jgi:hypothetical protein